MAVAAAAFTTEYVPLVLLLVFAGGAGASVNAASGRAVMSWFEPSQRGLALGIRQTALPLGGAAAAPGVAADRGGRGHAGGLARPRRPRAWSPRSPGASGLREAPPDEAPPARAT